MQPSDYVEEASEFIIEMWTGDWQRPEYKSQLLKLPGLRVRREIKGERNTRVWVSMDFSCYTMDTIPEAIPFVLNPVITDDYIIGLWFELVKSKWESRRRKNREYEEATTSINWSSVDLASALSTYMEGMLLNIWHYQHGRWTPMLYRRYDPDYNKQTHTDPLTGRQVSARQRNVTLRFR